ncbi:MAG: hypothetical protein V7L21_13535 [Nostoc sp.]|nr:hypothetical protein [Nostoc sp. NMS9]
MLNEEVAIAYGIALIIHITGLTVDQVQQLQDIFGDQDLIIVE